MSPLVESRGICENCLFFGDGIVQFPIGPRNGTLKEPWWETIALCKECRKTLLAHDLKGLGERYRDHRPAEETEPKALSPGGTSARQPPV